MPLKGRFLLTGIRWSCSWKEAAGSSMAAGSGMGWDELSAARPNALPDSSQRRV